MQITLGMNGSDGVKSAAYHQAVADASWRSTRVVSSQDDEDSLANLVRVASIVGHPTSGWLVRGRQSQGTARNLKLAILVLWMRGNDFQDSSHTICNASRKAIK
jgi:hypothetical protein